MDAHLKTSQDKENVQVNHTNSFKNRDVKQQMIAWVDPEWGQGSRLPWKITSGYRFPYKFLYGSPSRSNWTPWVQLLLEGGPYEGVQLLLEGCPDDPPGSNWFAREVRMAPWVQLLLEGVLYSPLGPIAS